MGKNRKNINFEKFVMHFYFLECLAVFEKRLQKMSKKHTFFTHPWGTNQKGTNFVTSCFFNFRSRKEKKTCKKDVTFVLFFSSFFHFLLIDGVFTNFWDTLYMYFYFTEVNIVVEKNLLEVD